MVPVRIGLGIFALPSSLSFKVLIRHLNIPPEERLKLFIAGEFRWTFSSRAELLSHSNRDPTGNP